MPRTDRQWNSRDGGAAASMGDCNSAGSLNKRGSPHDPRYERLSPAAGNTIVHTHNDTDTGYAKRRDTRQSAARLGKAPQDHLCARVILIKTAAARDHGKNSRRTGRLNDKETKCKGARKYLYVNINVIYIMY